MPTAVIERDRPSGAPPGGPQPARRWTQRAWLGAALALLAVGVAVYALRNVASLLILSGLVAYAIQPLVDRLHHSGIPRGAGAILVLVALVLVAVGVVLLLLPTLLHQGTILVAERFPQLVAYADATVIPWFERVTGMAMPEPGRQLGELLLARVRELAPQVAQPLATVLQTSLRGALGAIQVVLNALLFPVFVFYIARDYPRIVTRVDSLVPLAWSEEVRGVAHEVDATLSAFLRGQLTVCALLGILYALGLGIVGIEGAIVLGIVTGFLNLIPYLGTTVGLTLSLSLAVIDFRGWGPVLGVAIVFATVQSLEGLVITPRIVGQRVGLSPIGVIIALMAAGELFGFLGVLLAVPAAATLKVLARPLLGRYFDSPFYRSQDSARRSDAGVATPSGAIAENPRQIADSAHRAAGGTAVASRTLITGGPPGEPAPSDGGISR